MYLCARRCLHGGDHSLAINPEDELHHDVTDELAAYKLAQLPFPGVFYESDRPTKNALEKEWIDQTPEKLGNPSDLQLLQKAFDRMK
jgi:2-oxoglutarate/2-oxoacid ferredoxin oxidoreductase subunit beta